MPIIVTPESPVEVSEASHLTPVESVFSANPTIAEYELCVAKALRLSYDLDLAICVSAFCLPSFQPEWAVFLVRLDKDCYEVHSSDFAEPMWGNKDPSTIQARKRKRYIDSRFGTRIETMFQNQLATVQYHDNDRHGADGVTFTFSASHPSKGIVAGTTWSPEPESVPGKMVELAVAMCTYVLIPEDKSDEFLNKMNAVFAWFEANEA